MFKMRFKNLTIFQMKRQRANIISPVSHCTVSFQIIALISIGSAHLQDIKSCRLKICECHFIRIFRENHWPETFCRVLLRLNETKVTEEKDS